MKPGERSEVCTHTHTQTPLVSREERFLGCHAVSVFHCCKTRLIWA